MKNRALLEDISRNIVAEVAPEELDLFDDLAEEYYQDPELKRQHTRGGEGPLSFGSVDMLPAATPIIMVVATVVLELMLDVLKEIVASKGADFATNKVRMWFTGKARADLTAKQINEIREISKQAVLQHGYSEEHAQKIADAMTNMLITG